ncbi:MAG: hypothetical protein ABSD75_21525 [Terriglobales bacterium]|jgi:hypothetical protein
MSEDKIVPARTAAERDGTPALAGLLREASDPALTEDLALALLKRPDLPVEVLEQLAKNANALKSRKAKIALAGHPHTPRHVSVPLARQFYTFDVMKLALSPGVPADVRIAVDDVLISRLQTVTIGERLTLARRASGRVAAALLTEATGSDGTKVDGDAIDEAMAARHRRLLRAALENPRLTEALVIKAVLHPAAGSALVEAVAHHERWSRRRAVRATLLRCQHLSLAQAQELAREIPVARLRELLATSRLPDSVKKQLLREN